MKNRPLLLLLATLPLLALRCGGGTEDGDDWPDFRYPEPPYGHTAGSVIENITCNGFRNLESEMLEPLSLSDYYNPDDEAERSRMLVIDVSALWCYRCQFFAEGFAYACEELQGHGMRCLTAIIDGNTSTVAATEADVRWWQRSGKKRLDQGINDWQVIGPICMSGDIMSKYVSRSSLPIYMAIDTRTMTLIDPQSNPAEIGCPTGALDDPKGCMKKGLEMLLESLE